VLDYSDEYQFWDNPEPVTVVVNRPTEEYGVTTIPVAVAQRGSPRRNSQFFNGVQLKGNEILWKLPVPLMDNVIPLKGSTITDEAGVSWVIETVTEIRIGSSRGHFEALCRQGRR